jgi:hypothetical protein
MSRITFECVDQEGELFTVSTSSDNAAIEGVVAAMVQAYKRDGIEVISATRIEEVVVDVNLYAPERKQPTVSNAALQWMAGRGGKLIERGAAFGALALAVIGFDDGFSVMSLSHHVAKLMPALGHLIHLA